MISRLKHNLKKLNTFLKDEQRKKLPIIIYQVVLLTFIKKEIPFYYFGRMVYRKNSGNFKDYLSTKEYYRIINSKKLNSIEFNTIMKSKLFFSMFCEKNNLPIAKMWSYNFNNTFYFNEKTFYIVNIEKLITYFKDVFEHSKKESLFLKPFGEKGGRGIYLLKLAEIESQLYRFGDKLLNGFYIHEEVIVQHPEINKIYPKSINTLRIMTYLDKKGTRHFLETCMRFGCGGHYVDNVSSGGFEVSTNKSLGTLYDKGYQQLGFGGNVFFQVHPDTKYPFYNFNIPYYKEAHDLCLELSNKLPNRLTGWDIAITPNGPVIIEANSNPDITIGESHYQGYLKHPIYKTIISEI